LGHDGQGKCDDHGEGEEGDDDGAPESVENLGNLLEEIGKFDFFSGGAPNHVVREQMGKYGAGQG